MNNKILFKIKKYILCKISLHDWSKDINERYWQFHTAISECKICDERKILYQDVLDYEDYEQNKNKTT